MSHPWPPALGALEIPDPGLTMSEAVNVEGALRWFLYRSRAQGDAVLESAMEKLVTSLKAAATEHPEEWERVEQEVEMQKRFGLNG